MAMPAFDLEEGGASPLPFYAPTADECAVFETAYRNRLPLLLKGPTGCGKTRFVAHMAARLGLPLHTVKAGSATSTRWWRRARTSPWSCIP